MKLQNYHGIVIDTARDSLFGDQASTLLQKYYMLPDEKSPQEAYARAALAYNAGDMGLSQRIYDYASKGWFMFASPVLSNAPAPGQKPKALPISCFLSYVADTREALVDHQTELAWLSMLGGGVGGHWSDVREVTDKSPGAIPFLKVSDSAMSAYKQGKTRKGSYAAYLDVSHPDIIEFLNIRVPTGGDPNRKAFTLHNGINITDDFMECVLADANWSLKSRKTGQVVEVIKARVLWERMLEVRFRTGEPYLNFIDAANRALPQSQKNKGLKVNGSNLCNEIHLATNEERTAVCCLSSLNLEFYDEWKNTSIVRDLIRYLDNVLQHFIDNALNFPGMKKAVYSATMERSLGLGGMGFHSYLQRNSLPWESPMAVGRNIAMWRHIKAEAVAESQLLAVERGEPEDMKGTGMRNAHLLAIAPNANSSLIIGCSPSIEPWKANAYSHRTRVGTHLIKNQYLERDLAAIGMNTPEVWSSIVLNSGSIAHLDVDDWLKDTYKTANELDQHWLIEHAAKRQPFVCQGQSLNVFFPEGAQRSYVNSVHLKAWKAGLKGMYYLRTDGKKADKVSEKITRVALSDLINQDDCIACQG